MAFAATVPKVLRGDPEAPATVAEVRRWAIIDAHDSDFGSSAADMEAWVALADGAFAKARDAWLTQAEASDTNAPFALPRAGKSAVLAGDAAGARDALDRLTLNGTRGRVIDIERLTIEAGIAAIDGRTSEAVSAFRVALAAMGRDGPAVGPGLGGMDGRRGAGTDGAGGSSLGRGDSADPRAARGTATARPAGRRAR